RRLACPAPGSVEGERRCPDVREVRPDVRLVASPADRRSRGLGVNRLRYRRCDPVPRPRRLLDVVEAGDRACAEPGAADLLDDRAVDAPDLRVLLRRVSCPRVREGNETADPLRVARGEADGDVRAERVPPEVCALDPDRVEQVAEIVRPELD